MLEPEASPPRCSVGLPEFVFELSLELPAEASPPLWSVGRSGSGGGALGSGPEPLAERRKNRRSPNSRHRHDACGAGWACRSGSRLLRRSWPPAWARASPRAAAGACRIRPRSPARARQFQCRRGLMGLPSCNNWYSTSLARASGTGGRDRYPRPEFLAVVDADGHEAAGFGFGFVASPLKDRDGAQRGRVFVGLCDLAGILRGSGNDSREAECQGRPPAAVIHKRLEPSQ